MSIPNTYDHLIRAACKRYLPGVDWRLLKAQLWQESRFIPSAVSPAGAEGIAQFMPGTWAEVKHLIDKPNASPFDVEPAIEAAACYMAQQIQGWEWEREDIDRYMLALASYNAGFGNILRAQKLWLWYGNMPVDYASIISLLHEVTGKDNADETKGYVLHVFSYYLDMVMGSP